MNTDTSELLILEIESLVEEMFLRFPMRGFCLSYDMLERLSLPDLIRVRDRLVDVLYIFQNDGEVD